MNRSGRRGITLIETMIAMLILTFVMAAALGTFLVGRFAIMDAKHRVKAVYLLQDRMEWVKAQSAAAVESWIDSPLDSEDDVDDSIGTDELLDDTRTTTVGYDDETGEMLEVTITLTWEGRRLGGASAQNQESVVTLICP